MKELIRIYPHHQVPKWQLVQSFYDGLAEGVRQMVDSSCGNTFMMKSEDEAWNLFETLSENSMHHASSSSQGSRQAPTILKKGLCKVSQPAGIALPSKEWEEMKVAVQQLRSRASLIPPPPAALEACTICASPLHDIYSCPSGEQFAEVTDESANIAKGYPNQGGQ